MTRLLGALAVVLAALPAVAEHPDARKAGIEVNPGHADPAGLGLWSVESAHVLEHFEVVAGLTYQTLDQPLVLRSATDAVADRPLVGRRHQMDLAAAVGLFERTEVALVLPIILQQDAALPGFGLEPPASAGVGDLSLRAKALLLQQGQIQIGGVVAPVSLSLATTIRLPTGDDAAYLGTGGMGVDPTIVVTQVQGAVEVAINLGLRFQPRVEILDWTEHHKLVAGIAALYRPSPRGWSLGIGFDHMTRLDAPYQSPHETAGEALIGGRLPLTYGLQLEAGGGYGVMEGSPTPVWRAFFGLAWSEAYRSDRDGDGVVDRRDPCPDDPEDFDEFKDGDGCPDPDNDEDGVPDTADQCPLDPEDKDQFDDADGCPDPDNDADQILDADDKCPNEPEDMDGHEDADGCPDLDRDKDGILDAEDKCPDEAEDKDLIMDQDGCPETDADGDEIPDEQDQCPLDAEDIDLEDDEDGCPDLAPEASLTDDRIEVNQRILFEFGKAAVRPESFPILDEVARILRQNPALQVRIEGHTDSEGASGLNQSLSEARAQAVRALLLSRSRIEGLGDRITTIGFGPDRPRATNDTEGGRAHNRRVEFIVLTTEKTP